MKAHMLFTKAAASVGTVALAITMVGCAHHSVLDTTAQNTGQIRTEQSAQSDATPGNTLGTAPAPSNAQGVSSTTSTPAIISGPASVDSTGRVYTSSSVGSAGNGSATGLNTNVNIIPKTQKSTVTVTESMPAPTPIVTETPTTTQVAEVTPAPAPVYTPAPVVESTPAPMTSSTTETTTTTTTHHRRLRKD